jgi:outer membrane protein OmpA-like peptidoglycan-associated protein
MMINSLNESSLSSSIIGVILLLSVSGCVATKGWVQEQMTPIAGRLSEIETRVGQNETKLSHASARADRALDRLDHLRLEKRFVLNLREEANFASDSATLRQETRRQIDLFVNALKEANDALLIVAGHTDSTGPEDYNYELGQKRATNVARYLITRRGLDPTRVTAVSYGASVPLSDNRTPEGRRQNRRIEILVYKENIVSSPGGQRLELQRSGQSSLNESS